MTLAEKLEFTKILGYTERLTLSELGKSKLGDAHPIVSLAALDLELRKTNELKNLLQSGEDLPVQTLPDTREAYQKLGVAENFLSPRELLQVADSLKAASQLKKFVFSRQERFPNLNLLTENLWLEKSFQYEIGRIVDEFAEVRNTASDALAHIRSTLIDRRNSLRRKMESLQRKYAQSEMLMDDGITIRGGRLVLAFKTEYKYQIQGFIHDLSQSGQTVFIEPTETLVINNEIRDLEIQEIREVERILREMARSLRKEIDNLLSNQEILAQFDALYAKARFAMETNSSMPQLTAENHIRLIDAFHPWLLITNKPQGKPVVPITLELGGNKNDSGTDGETNGDAGSRTLIITGPNAGGKSVTMKTLGLLSYMIQFGFLVPCFEESVFPVFDNIYVEIGDEQSIENDLSTFSSHLRNLKEILDHATHESLVLIDEIASGTDPEEGAAIATAILESLLARHAITVVTTHQGTLKAYAHERAGVANGSMQFDAEHLMPTYQFRMGLPGSSFALEMARRLGFAPHVLENAKLRMGESKHALETLIAELSRKVQETDLTAQRLLQEKEEIRRLSESYALKLRELEREKKELRRKSLDEAKRVLASANTLIEKTVQEIKQTAASSEAIKGGRKQVEKMRRDLAAESAAIESEVKEPIDANIHVGDKVKLLDTNTIGEVMEVKDDDAVISFGNFRMKTQIRNLEKISNRDARDAARSEAKKPEAATNAANFAQAFDIKDGTTRLDLRGLLGDEALTQIDKFLDESLRQGAHKLDLIHGNGTGALRKRVTEFLKSDKRVKSFRLGNWDEGGTGVTVVEV
ncbi:MAG: endonuclease MutS2 [Rhizobacter sp.]|nr:endonuclease MutS2 [Chlorobiales bacterium]